MVSIQVLSLSLCVLLLAADRGTAAGSALGAPVPTSVGRESSGGRDKTGSAVDAGEFYRVGERKIRLLRSLGKVAVRHAPGQGPAIRSRLESIPPVPQRFKVDKELPKERMLVLQTPGITTSDELREAIGQLRSQPDVNQALPVYINEESGLEMIPTEQFVVKLAAEAPLEQLEAINDSLGAVLVRPLQGATDQFILSLPGSTPEELLAVLELYGQYPAIEWASPDFVCQVARTAMNDTYYAQQWHLDNTGQSGGTYDADVDAPEAWDITVGNNQVVIALIDDGMDLTHEDLKDNLPGNTGEIADNGIDDDHNGYVDDRNGWDFYGDNGDRGDKDPSHQGTDYHGTLTAGVAAARGNNNRGVVGCAFGCRLMPLRDGPSDTIISTAEAEAIRYAAGFAKNGVDRWRGADVINISSGYSQNSVISSALQDAVEKGRNGKGCPIFCAVGNGASGWKQYELAGIPAGTYTFKWEYKKDGSSAQGDDTVWLDSVTFPGGEEQRFESAALPSGWSTGGSASWFSVQNGQSGNHAMTGYNGLASRAVRAGAVGDNGTSYLEVRKTVSGGSLVFWCWSSCEEGYDGLRLYVNGGPQYQGKLIATGLPVLDPAIAYPASHPATIAVGSSTNFDYRADHSCYGADLDFLAPGGGGSDGIWTTAPMGRGDAGGNYGAVLGTSFASPLAAGVAALLFSKNPDLTAQQIRDTMRSACDKIDSVSYTNGRNDYCGFGRINARKALDAVPAAGAQNPAPVTWLTFEGVATNENPHIPNGYGGFSWSGSFCVHKPPAGSASGYVNGLISPDYVAYNGDGNPVEFSGGSFTLVGAYLTGAWRDGLNIEIGGYRSGSRVYSRTVSVSSRATTWVQLDYAAVDRVTFTSSGGTHNPAFSLDGVHFVMDDMAIRR